MAMSPAGQGQGPYGFGGPLPLPSVPSVPNRNQFYNGIPPSMLGNNPATTAHTQVLPGVIPGVAAGGGMMGMGLGGPIGQPHGGSPNDNVPAGGGPNHGIN